MRHFAILLVAVALALTICACRTAPPAPEPTPAPAPAVERIHVITAVGYGAPRPDAPPAQAKLLAKKAAQLDAERNLNEKLFGLSIDGKTTVRDFVTQSDSVKTYTDGYLKGVNKIREDEQADGTVETEVELNLDEFWQYLDSQRGK